MQFALFMIHSGQKKVFGKLTLVIGNDNCVAHVKIKFTNYRRYPSHQDRSEVIVLTVEGIFRETAVVHSDNYGPS